MITVDAQGMPRVALLSVGEVLAAADASIRVALYPTSSTTTNLRERGQTLLALVIDGACFQYQLSVQHVAPRVVSGRELALFVMNVVAVRHDEVPYARMTSEATYRLLGQEAEVLDRWRQTITQLEELDLMATD